ncbi:HNH endonuclease [Enterovibrio norvegicus]|uniref:HNH endonuclease n=1 Tax=Enterovibrio norvegicus TaxID=188144 RepID=UPI001F530E59|nr:HNH endonuclease [Enterovibrio norvegicus]
MAKIVAAQYGPVFDLGLKVESGQLKASDVIEIVTKSTGLNETSARYCLDAVLAMPKGVEYKHTINIQATKFYLQRFEGILTPSKFDLVLLSVEKHLAFYVAQGKGDQVTIRALVDSYRVKLAQQAVSPIYPDEVYVLPSEFTEGSIKQVTINAYERNPKARAACIAEHKAICQVCNFDFEAIYGAIGKGFIHIHHKVDLATIGKSYQVDPINDLIPVCPNCHAMLHTEEPAMDIEKLKLTMS